MFPLRRSFIIPFVFWLNRQVTQCRLIEVLQFFESLFQILEVMIQRLLLNHFIWISFLSRSFFFRKIRSYFLSFTAYSKAPLVFVWASITCADDVAFLITRVVHILLIVLYPVLISSSP